MTLQEASPIAPSPPVTVHQSPWHTPVPYLFGGLASMLILIAFALLVLAFFFSRNAGDTEDGHGDLEAGDSKPNNHNMELPPVFEDKYLVIMAGQAKPTFLATPVSSRASSFGSCSCRSNSTEESSTTTTSEVDGKVKEEQGSSDQLQVRTTVNQETAHQVP